MSEVVTYTIAAVLACSVLSYAACLIIQSFPSVLKRYGGLVLAFGAGAMLGDVFLHILPHSTMGVSEDALVRNGYAFIGGIIATFVIESAIGAIQVYSKSHNTEKSSSFSFLNWKPMAVTNLLCDLVHNGVDGISIALAFMAGPKIGLSTTLAVLAHELAQELGDFVVLVHSGMSVRQATMCNVAVSFSALITAATTLYLGQGMDPATQNLFVAAAGGAFIYMALVDILPEALQAQGCDMDTHSHAHSGDLKKEEEEEQEKKIEEDNETLRKRKVDAKPAKTDAKADADKVEKKSEECRKHHTRRFISARLLVVIGIALGVFATALVSLVEDHDHHHHGHGHRHHHDHDTDEDTDELEEIAAMMSGDNHRHHDHHDHDHDHDHDHHHHHHHHHGEKVAAMDDHYHPHHGHAHHHHNQKNQQRGHYHGHRH